MAVGNINPALRKQKGDGYETLKNAITQSKGTLKKITRRDAVFLLNKQFEGISETKGNLYIYMFYYSCTDPAGLDAANSIKWYNYVNENDSASESTAWCACYVSFVLNMTGIGANGHWNAAFSNLSKALDLKEIKSYDSAKTMDTVYFNGQHVGFAVKEDSGKPNNYSGKLYVIGGNQGDSVKLNPSVWYGEPTSFGTKDSYEDEISAGDVLSMLAYFTDAHTKTVEQRKTEINARINQTAQISTSLANEVRKIRALIGEAFPTKGGLYIKDKHIRARFKELLTFEDSITEGSLIVTQNISQKQTKVKTTN